MFEENAVSPQAPSLNFSYLKVCLFVNSNVALMLLMNTSVPLCTRKQGHTHAAGQMTELSDFSFSDLLEYNFVNLDQLTETYSVGFYGEYLTHWPEYQRVARHPNGLIMGYVLGKVEGEGEDWHGHVSAVTVAPTFRRLGIGELLMEQLERTTSAVHNAYFVDLFVRSCNHVAFEMYRRLGYTVYRRVLGYYRAGGAFPKDEDALDLRKAMPRDTERRRSSVIPLTRPIQPHELEWH
jgi:N-terminal acetyltransferase B complex catalytic subunit